MKMNKEKVRALIEFYIQNEIRIHFNQIEGYKWDILSSVRDEIIAYTNKHYRHGEWDTDFSDFHDFTNKTIGKTGNLVYHSSRSVMQKAADKYPEFVRNMFIDLSGTNSDKTIENRVNDFIKQIDELARDNPDISKSGKSFHNDYRAVSVYLLLLDPSKYYNYMYSTFAEFSKFVDLKIPKAGDIHLLLEYYKACNEIEQTLQHNYYEWFNDYLKVQKQGDVDNKQRTDICGHLLVQDIIFAVYYFNHPEALANSEKSIVHPKPFNGKPHRRIVGPGNGILIDYEKQHRNNILIGNAAENFVLENERRLVAEYGYDPNRVQHVSKEQGDGLGYDILSCDKDGRDIYIEVKGTKGGIKNAFYITETELQCSILNEEKYRLYRVYDFSVAGTIGKGKIAVIKGSLRPYCINPVSYLAIF